MILWVTLLHYYKNAQYSDRCHQQLPSPTASSFKFPPTTPRPLTADSEARQCRHDRDLGTVTTARVGVRLTSNKDEARKSPASSSKHCHQCLQAVWALNTAVSHWRCISLRNARLVDSEVLQWLQVIPAENCLLVRGQLRRREHVRIAGKGVLGARNRSIVAWGATVAHCCNNGAYHSWEWDAMHFTRLPAYPTQMCMRRKFKSRYESACQCSETGPLQVATVHHLEVKGNLNNRDHPHHERFKNEVH